VSALFVRIALDIWSLLCFLMNFRIFFYFCEECHCNFGEDCIASVDASGDILNNSLRILTILTILQFNFADL
jgi:hypothetical protein